MKSSNVLAELVAEVLAGQAVRPTGASSRRFVHLPITRAVLSITPIVHLEPERVPLRCAPRPGKYEKAAGSVAILRNQLHDDDGLADTGATEQPDLTALGEGGHQVMTLIPVSSTSVSVACSLTGARTVDRQPDLRLDLALPSIAHDDVHHAAQRPLPTGTVIDRRCPDLRAANQPSVRIHGDGSHHVVATVLLDFQHERPCLPRSISSA